MILPEPSPRVRNYEQLALGLFVHWGLYSLLEEGEWIQHLKHIPCAEYDRLLDKFTARDFSAEAIVELARQAGMKYICFTSKHHEGFSLYDTKGLNRFDSMHSPARRDFCRELADACHKENIRLFFYHSTLDWHQESYRENWGEYLQYLRQSVELLCRGYGEIGGFWFDGTWNKEDADWEEDKLYSIIRTHQPNAVIINNSSTKARGEAKFGDVDVVTFEDGLPSAINAAGAARYLAGEMCGMTNSNWGFARHDFKYKGPADIVRTIAACRKTGANYLHNVGPTGEGGIPEYDAALLKKVGEWVSLFAEGLYLPRPSSIQTAAPNFVLENDNRLYLFIHEDYDWNQPSFGLVPVKDVAAGITEVSWLDNGERLPFAQDMEKKILTIDIGRKPDWVNFIVRVAVAVFS